MDVEAQKRLEDLVVEAREHLGKDNFYEFEPVKWSDEGGTNPTSLSDYLLELGEVFERKIKALVDKVLSHTYCKPKYFSDLTIIAIIATGRERYLS